MWKGDQQGDLEFKASVNNLACSHVFLRGQQRLSFFSTSWEIFLVSCCFQTGLCLICWTLLLRLPLGWKDLSSILSPQIFQMALISILAMEINVNECCRADERSRNVNECSDALRLLHLHCWPSLQLFFKHTLFFWKVGSRFRQHLAHQHLSQRYHCNPSCKSAHQICHYNAYCTKIKMINTDLVTVLSKSS